MNSYTYSTDTSSHQHTSWLMDTDDEEFKDIVAELLETYKLKFKQFRNKTSPVHLE